jgi:hypothetical protein
MQAGAQSRPLAVWIAAAVILAAALAVRVPVLVERPLAGYFDNEDATAHVLATMVAYAQTDWRVHEFLPILSLGAPHDKWIAETPGAARFDALGNAVYTSWPPGFFIVAYGVSRALGIPPSPIFLRCFNLALQVACCVLLAMLCGLVAEKAGAPPAVRNMAAATGFIVYAASPETLYSHLFAYWGQPLYQPILLAQTILFLRGRGGWGFYALAFVGGFVEWTALVANAGFILAFLARYFSGRGPRPLWAAAGLMLVNLAVIGLLLVWFTRRIPLAELLSAQQDRAAVRMFSLDSLYRLGIGYGTSLGAFFLLFLPPMRAAIAGRRGWRPSPTRLAPPEREIILVTGFPLVENLLLANHASIYSYDRLKWVGFAAVVASLILAKARQRRAEVVGLAMLAAALSIVWFGVTRLYVVPPSRPEFAVNRELGRLVRATAADDALAFTNVEARGAMIYYSGRNLYPSIDESARRAGLPLPDFVRSILRQRRFAAGIVYRLLDDRGSVEILRVSAAGPDVARETANLALGPAD